MKEMLAIGLLALISSCNNAEKKEEAMAMPGAYRMLSQSVNDGKKDTTYTGLKQLKIYTATHMMYVNVNPKDSVSGFGIATYNTMADTVIENVMYSASDTSANNNKQDFTLIIQKTAKGYKQVIPEIKIPAGSIKLTEEYETVSTTEQSPLDGAWREVKAYQIKGKDTTVNKTIQYKMYYAGHFMFGHTWLDSTYKIHVGMGFGTFEMKGSKVKENVMASSYYQIRDQSFDIDIEMNGNDEFKQTITDKNGTKAVEIYQRLKK